jgi:hypothetical protein
MFVRLASRRLALASPLFLVAILTVPASGRAQELPITVGRLPAVWPPTPRRTVIPPIGPDTATPPPFVIAGAAATASVRAGRLARQEILSVARSIDYSGPRFGVTYLPKAAIDSLKAHNISVGTTITQFGWQFEREIHVSPDGPRVLNEWVFLAGGLESGVFLPSLTWLIGARDRTGNEIGVGPNVSVAGVGLAAAAGVTVHDGGVNFPMNVAVAKSKTGARVSFLTGFTIH